MEQLKLKEMRKKLLLVLCLAMSLTAAFAQQKVKDGTITGSNLPNKDAVLELESSNKGLLHTRVALRLTTDFFPLTAHVPGMMVYNTATAGDVTPGIYFNDGSKWVRAQTGTFSVTGGTNITVTGTGTAADPFKINTGKSTISQNLTTGVITHTNEAGDVKTVNIISTNTGNVLTVGTDGGAVLSASAFPVVTSDNGLTKLGTNIQLGGELTKATTIVVDPTKTLAVKGLQTGAATDRVVVVDPVSGVLKAVTGASLIPATTVSNISIGNSLTTTVNGVTGTSVPIINSNANSLTGTALTTTVNGVASTALDLTPAIKAATSNTLTNGTNTITSTVNGVIATAPAVNTNVLGFDDTNKLTSTVNGVVSNAIDLTALKLTAENGLNKVGTKILLGGPLTMATAIGTDATKTLALTGLQKGALTDSLVAVDGNGVLRKLSLDLRKINNNHITEDAGVGGNGTNAGAGVNGDFNIGIGKNTLSANNFGYGNIAIGGSGGNVALKSNRDGLENIALGGALIKNTDGSSNIALGYGSLGLNTLGTENIGIGTYSLNKINDLNTTVGFGNTAVGARSLSDLLTGTNNIGVGEWAGIGQTAGDLNIFIGKYTAPNISPIASNQLNIGNWIFGNNGKIGIGNLAKTPSDRLDISDGNLRVRDINSLAGAASDKVVVADANGVLKTVTAASINNTTFDNGLTKTGTNVQLGGPLTKPTSISSDATNTLALPGLQTGLVTDSVLVAGTNGVLKRVARSTFEADLRLVGSNNHITKDAGIGSNGTNVGSGAASIFIGQNSGANGSTERGNVAVGAETLKSLTNGGYSTAIGYRALSLNTTGSQNTAVGYNSLALNTDGFWNTGLGYYTLTNNTSGRNNVAIGSEALEYNTTGLANVALGTRSMLNNISGFGNVALGGETMANITTSYFNTAAGNQSSFNLTSGAENSSFGAHTMHKTTTGSYNVVMGREALYNNISGSGNTALGYHAGYDLTSGDSNIFLGRNAQPNVSITGSNQLNIGNWIFGDNGKIGIGSASIIPSERLDVGNGNLRVRDINSLAGAATDKVVVADANGVLKTVTAASINNTTFDNGLTKTGTNVQLGGPLTKPTIITSNAANTLALPGLQTGAIADSVLVAGTNGVLKRVARSTFEADLRLVGTNNHITKDAGLGNNGTSIGSGFDNVAISMGSMSSNVGSFGNIAIGKNTLQANQSGNYNIAIGDEALKSTKSNRSIAIGSASLSYNTVGINNLAIGGEALRFNTTGNTNLAIGEFALTTNGTGSSNIALGDQALRNNTVGQNNLAIGAASLQRNETGEGNIAVGIATLLLNQYGINNTAIGAAAGTNAKGSGNILLGYNAGGNYLGDNRLMIHNSNTNTPLIDGNFATKVLTVNNTLKVADLATGAPATTSNRPVVADANGQLMIGTAPISTTAIVKKTAAYTVSAMDYTILANATGAGFTLTLPTAASSLGRILVIRKTDETSNILTFSESVKISETTSFTTLNVNTTIRIQSDGTDWYKID